MLGGVLEGLLGGGIECVLEEDCQKGIVREGWN